MSFFGSGSYGTVVVPVLDRSIEEEEELKSVICEEKPLFISQECVVCISFFDNKKDPNPIETVVLDNKEYLNSKIRSWLKRVVVSEFNKFTKNNSKTVVGSIDVLLLLPDDSKYHLISLDDPNLISKKKRVRFIKLSLNSF